METKKSERQGHGQDKSMPKHKGTFSADIPGPRREEFRRYLEKTGILDALSVAFAHLFEEDSKVTNPVDYMINRLMNGAPSKVEMGSFRAEKEILEKEIVELKSLNKNLNEKMEFEKEREEKALAAALFAATASATITVTTPDDDFGAETQGED